MHSKKNHTWVWFSIIIVGLLLVIFGNNTFGKITPQMSASDEIDEQTKTDIYNVLWQKDIENWPANLPASLTNEKLQKVSPKTFGQEVATMLQDIKSRTLPLVQRYPERYDYVTNLAQKGMNTKQAYALGETMGIDYFAGYAGMKSIKELQFPRDWGMHTDFQYGWNFFVSNLKDEKGNDVDLLVTYFRRAIYPPDIAKKMGLSTIENQIVEQVVGLGYADKNIHVQAHDPAISGKTGLVELNNDPYTIKLGNNEVKSTQSGKLLPFSMKIYDPEKDIEVDLTYEETKPIFFEGDDGKVPSIYNIGTWYYSIPAIKVSGTVSLAGDKREVSGTAWYDNQWSAGTFPTGYPDNLYIRGLSNILNKYKDTPPAGFGWDWMEVQFEDDTQITLSNVHSTSSKDLNNLGDNPPADITNDGSGKFIDTDGNAQNVDAKITINKWFRSEESGAWYPDGWKVEVPDKKLSFTMNPTTPHQLFHTAAGSEFREGGVKATGTKDGKDITGYGFGEGTAYAGEDYYFKTKFGLLGIENNQSNRDLFTQPVPSWWLTILSVLFYLISLIAVVWILVCLYRLIFKHNK